MIPKLIHQTWHTPPSVNALAAYQASWQTLNPDCHYHFYTDQDCLDFVSRYFPQLEMFYLALPYPVQKADLFRYLVVYEKGGLYADIDMACLRPFTPFFQASGALFAIEAHLTSAYQRQNGYPHPFQIANCIFAAEAKHPFLAYLIEQLTQHPIGNAETVAALENQTGPRLLTRCYFQFQQTPQNPLSLLPQIFWIPPLHYPLCWPFNINVYARHHFLGSWKRPFPTTPHSLKQRWQARSRWPNPWPRGIYFS